MKNLSDRIEALLEQFDLVTAFGNVKCGVLSSGEQTRVCHRQSHAEFSTPLLLLDEPTASLDPAKARDIRARRYGNLLARGSGGVLWTSHNMYEIEDVCVIACSSCRKGKILLEGDPKTLRSDYGNITLEDLFIAVADEPMAHREPVRIMNFTRAAVIVLRQAYLMRESPARVLPLFAWVAHRCGVVGLHHSVSQHRHLS